MSSKIAVGKIGESLTTDYLQNCSYQIYERNYHTRFGEVDLVTKQVDCVVFVVVKTDRSRRFGVPQAAVTPKKQQHISAVAAHHLQVNQLFDQPCRFDVLTIRLNWQNWLIDLQHIENAFLYVAATES